MNSKAPVVRAPVVDRLAFILPWAQGSGDEQKRLMPRIKRRLARAIAAHTCVRAYRKGGRYLENFDILLPGGATALIQIGALQPAYQKGGIRVVLNPARCGPDGIRQLHLVMGGIVGRRYDELMKQPLINNVDFAVDVEGVDLDQLLVGYKKARRFTTFGKRINSRGRIEGHSFGAVTSDYMAVAYDKRQERIHAAINALVRAGGRGGTDRLVENAITRVKRARDQPPLMRIEVRGKKLRGLRLCKLVTLPNRFERFRFVYLGDQDSNLPAPVRLGFVSLCRDLGVKAALETFKHTEHARAIHAYWRAGHVNWWQPEKLWLQGCEAVKEIGLFPDQAFEPAE